MRLLLCRRELCRPGCLFGWRGGAAVVYDRLDIMFMMYVACYVVSLHVSGSAAPQFSFGGLFHSCFLPAFIHYCMYRTHHMLTLL